MPAGATFVKADLNDGVALIRQAEGCGAILHFGGVSVEKPFEEFSAPTCAASITSTRPRGGKARA